VAANTRPAGDLARREVLRQVVDGLRVKLDGTAAAATVVARRRQVLNTVLEYAVELDALDSNPLAGLRWKKPKAIVGVDRRRVVNPAQARALLEAVARVPRSGRRLVAFFGCLYYAGLRPEEAAALNKRNLDIPAEGWGWLHLDAAEPHVGSEWTDGGTVRDRRVQLKHRERGQGRSAPCPPELTALLHAHMAEFGTGPDGRIFRGERNDGELPRLTVVKVWRAARAAVFPPEVLATPLAERPYDLRHAAVSTWLNGGVPATTVAEWAGHSVEVLLRIYARCLDGGVEALRQRVDEALRTGGESPGRGKWEGREQSDQGWLG
jgi:integrase